MTRTAKLIWIVAVALVVIIVLVILVKLRKHETKTPIASSPLVHVQPSYAPSGQPVATFPKYLLPGANPDITQSYSVPYNSQSQSTVEYTVQGSLNVIFQDYLTYFQADEYGVISKQQTATRDNIYASSKDADVSVMIVPAHSAGQSLVTVSYLKK